MADPRAGLPEGRYGRRGSDDARTDRRLTVIGLALGAVLLGFVAWAGFSYIGEQQVTGQLTGFDVVSDEEIQVNVAVRKPSGADGVCTVRAQADDGLEVGRGDFRFDDEGDSVHRAVTLRTTQRATSAELMGCSEAAEAAR
ncbi:DUF4307 domain-containing protein [Streptomyces radicis]|uniref:DUF4307 domain-containing protein n=1 Tax=Streptomyces radicis TaxID=1750517 RepID=A0A3A9W4B1_9ACTN|nr:DUF4307 domain-containing protein [Streptomyces radicis]RKN07592.1 DUF4307 domain-containing protein [Streptomyces radicis]RKN18315.1 DUF4307 domain-containing protein [Streptomyces radicis]